MSTLTDQSEETAELILVRADSGVQAIGRLLARSLEAFPRVTVRSIGASAFNQAIKAIVNARQQVGGHGDDLIVRPGFKTVEGIGGDPVSALVMNCTLLSTEQALLWSGERGGLQ